MKNTLDVRVNENNEEEKTLSRANHIPMSFQMIMFIIMIHFNDELLSRCLDLRLNKFIQILLVNKTKTFAWFR